MIERWKEMKRRERIKLLGFAGCTGVVAGVLFRLGSLLADGGSVWLLNDGNMLGLLGLCIFFALLTGGGLLFIDRKKKETGTPVCNALKKKSFLCLWGLIFVCWIPTFLAYYPTIWAYDVGNQIPKIMNLPMTTYQPILHTLYVQGLVQVGSSEGSYEIGMVLLSLTQMAGMSAIFAYAIEFVGRWGVGKIGKAILFVFFAFFPVNSILSVSMTKDVFFSGCCLLLCFKMYEWMDAPHTFLQSKKKVAGCLVLICVLLSLRSNGIFVFVPWVCLAVWLMEKKFRKYFLVFGVLGVVVYAGFQVALVRATDAEKGPAGEAYSVPMQCLIGTAIRHPELIPKKGEGEILMGVIPRDLFHENVADNLDPQIADPIKTCFWIAEQNGFEGESLLKTWITYGLQYPMDYVDIWGTLTLGAWYPLDESHAKIYHREGGRQFGYLLTDFKYITEMAMERPASKWPALEALYEKIATENVHQDIPVVNLLFVPATYCWVAAFFAILAIYQRRYRELIPLLFLFLYWGTVMLGPTILVRYLYPVIIAVPILICRFRCFSLNNASKSDTMPCRVVVDRPKTGNETENR